MKDTERLLVLSLVLCLVFCYASALRMYGIYDIDRTVQRELLALQKRKSELEQDRIVFQSRGQGDLEKRNNIVRLRYTNDEIEKIEKKLGVSYQDYLKMVAEQKGYYEKKMKDLQTDLETAKEKKRAEDIQRFQKQLDAVMKERDEIKKFYKEKMQSYEKIKEEMTQEQAKLEKELEDTKLIFNAAKNKHSRALEVISATSNEGYKPAHVPQMETINKLKEDMKKLVLTKNKKQQVDGLKLTKTKLEALLPVLHEKSTFYQGTDHSDIEEALSVMEENTAQLRGQQKGKWKEIVEKLKNGSTDVSEADIASLEKINEELKTTDVFAQVIAERSAYLKALLEVYNLSKECSDAIRDSESGVLAKLLSFAF